MMMCIAESSELCLVKIIYVGEIFCKKDFMRYRNLIGCLLMAASCMAQASGLGSTATISVQAPVVARSYASTDAGAVFTRNPMSLSGGTVTEFINASGVVFAVSWATPVMPSFTDLLGDYKSDFDRAQSRVGAAASRSHFSASEGDLVVVSEGRMRAYRGYAYLRSALPASFNIKELSQ